MLRKISLEAKEMLVSSGGGGHRGGATIAPPTATLPIKQGWVLETTAKLDGSHALAKQRSGDV